MASKPSISKLPMPTKKGSAPKDDSEMEFNMDFEEAEPNESEDEAMESEPEMSPLEDYTDEELMAEIRKRGLSADLEMEEAPAEESEEA